ncbi:DarT1-associated NADAR antitoxin family protein [Rhizobium panacihumi]|uniref:DarT1-associated NADAR antitoxin family protein n=1 Tax=Rhizobium panacihumi TaxID=2008450 RepID=UPI003D7B4771
MAERPIFVPTTEADGYVKRVDLEIPWAGGFAEVQKKKNIRSLHDAAKREGYFPLLEVSSKSDEIAGRHLSAFHLRVSLGERDMPLENAFQGSKVFEQGGPYNDLFEVDPREAKRDPRLRSSGALKGFAFDGFMFPLKPTTVFYDWLYLNAIFPHRQWLKNRVDGETRYDGFSDIEFNPSKSINCQAKSCALFVSLMRENKLDTYLETPSKFIAAMAGYMSDSSSHQPYVKQPRLQVG